MSNKCTPVESASRLGFCAWAKAQAAYPRQRERIVADESVQIPLDPHGVVGGRECDHDGRPSAFSWRSTHAWKLPRVCSGSWVCARHKATLKKVVSDRRASLDEDAPNDYGENHRLSPLRSSTMARISALLTSHGRRPKLSELDPKRPRHARRLGSLRRRSRDLLRVLRRYITEPGKRLLDPEVRVGFVLCTTEFQALQARGETDRLTYPETVELYRDFADAYGWITGSGSQVRGDRRQAGNLLIVAMLSATRGYGVWLLNGTDVKAETLVNALAEAWGIKPRTIRRAWERRNARVQ